MTSTLCLFISDAPKVVDMEGEYARYRQLSELFSAWKRFDPLQVTLTKINRQLEVLEQNPPRLVFFNLLFCLISLT